MIVMMIIMILFIAIVNQKAHQAGQINKNSYPGNPGCCK